MLDPILNPADEVRTDLPEGTDLDAMESGMLSWLRSDDDEEEEDDFRPSDDDCPMCGSDPDACYCWSGGE